MATDKPEALQLALDALDEIALAGMSGSGQESEEGMRDWHARQAWKFIGIAARAKTAISALPKSQAVQASATQAAEPEGLRDAIAQALTSVYVCGRVWDAWGYGTMSQDDFQPAAECAEVLDSIVHAARATGAAAPSHAAKTFQQRVDPWLIACFGETIARDGAERNHRFLEEALELVQAGGCTASEAHQLVDYVFRRPVGEMTQEVGGVMVTLAALCLAHGVDMHAAGETELARIWTKVEAIRAKQAAKPQHSPLPAAPAAPQGAAPSTQTHQFLKHQKCGCVLCTCEDEERCHGCGAVMCVLHSDPSAPRDYTAAPQGVEAELLELRDGAFEAFIDANASRHQRSVWEGSQPSECFNAGWRAALATASTAPAEPECCPYCDGSGECTGLDGGGPDAQEVTGTCPHCRGAQTLLAAYNTLAEDRADLQLKATQLGIFHSHATRYGWAPNQTDGMQSFEKLATEWLAARPAATQAHPEPIDWLRVALEAVDGVTDFSPCNRGPLPGMVRGGDYVDKVELVTALRAEFEANGAATQAPSSEARNALAEAYPWQFLELASRVVQAHYTGDRASLAESVRYLDVMSKRVAKTSQAERDVLSERQRQINIEGWTLVHDDGHDTCELAEAAAAYAIAAADSEQFADFAPSPWPWGDACWKPCGSRRMLVKAGALILAEIERIDRARAAEAGEGASHA